MPCPNCQQNNREEARFCRGCGHPLIATAENPSAVPVAATPPSSTVEGEVTLLSMSPQEATETVRHEAITVSLTPLPPGSLLQQRFEIGAVTQQSDLEIVYQARDRITCPQCGSTNGLDSQYCNQCGVELASQPLKNCLVKETTQPKPIEPDMVAQFEQAGRFYLILPEPPPPSLSSSVQPGLRLAVGFASHVGQVRSQNEDSVLAFTYNALYESEPTPSVGFYMVADGMGGHTGGAVASHLATQIVANWLTQYILLPAFNGEYCLPENAPKRLEEAIKDANGKIFLRRHQQNNDMGTTVTAALVLRQQVFIANVGDSRTYLWHEGKLKQVTQDHSAIARLIELGQAKPEEIYTHPQKTAIYRSLGDKPDVVVDTFEEVLTAGDKLLLCCDGVWETLRPEGLENVLLNYNEPQHVADEIIRQANLAGGGDNLSVIIVSCY